jgi:RNA-directed DNA polymerase
VVDADLESYFDGIPHDRLMALVAAPECDPGDGPVLSLVAGFLRQDIMKDMARWRPTTGTPQEPAPGLNRGAVISPLLANLYLHPLDRLIEEGGWRMVRYADDFVILCRTKAEAKAALRHVRAWVAANGLTLHQTRHGSATAANRGKVSNSSATGLRRAAGWCARRA